MKKTSFLMATAMAGVFVLVGVVESRSQEAE